MDFLSLVAKLSLDSKEYESGLDKAKSAASKIGGGIATGLKMAGAAVAAATTAVTGFAMTSVKTGMDFDKSMSQVAATMGMTSEEMQNQIGEVDLTWGHFSGNLRDYAQEMGANTKFSATEAADALNYMALAGYDVQTSMEMLPNVLNLAAAGAMDLATASDMVTDTQTAFGISLERTSQMVDEMAKAASTGNTNVEQLGNAFLTVGGLAQELNGGVVALSDGSVKAVDGVQELEIALTAMANAGIKGSEAGTHMRNMLLKLSSPTDEGAKQLRKMGVEVFDTEGKMRSLGDVFNDLRVELGKMTQEDKIKVISDLFNTRDLASAESLLNAVNTSWDSIGESILTASEAGVEYEGKLYSMKEAQEKFGDAIYDAEQGFKILGAAELMAREQENNLQGDLTSFGSALEGVKIKVSDALTPTFRQFTQEATKGLQDVNKAIREGGLSAGITAAGGIVANILTSVVTALPDAINAGVQLMGAIGQGLAQNAPDIGNAILTAAGDLAGTGVSLMQKIADGMKEFDFSTTAHNIGQWLSDAISSDTGEGFINAALSIIGSLARGIGESYSELVPIGTEIISNLATSIIDNIDGIVEGGIALIEGITEGMNKGQLKLIEMIPQIFVSLVGAILRNAPKLAAAVLKVVALTYERWIMTIPTLITMLTNLIGNIINLIVTQGDVIVMNAVSVALNVVTGIINAIINLPETLAGIAGHIIGSFIHALGDAPAKTKSVFDKVIPVVIEFGKKFIAEAPKMAKKFVEDLPKNLQSLPSKMRKIGKDVVDALKNGVQNAWDSFISWIKNKAKSIVDAFLGGVKDSSRGKSGGKSGTKNSTSSVNTTGIRDTIEAVEQIQNAVKFNENDYQSSHGLTSETFKIDYDELANTIVRAFEKADFSVEVDGREFGRMVRRAVTT